VTKDTPPCFIWATANDRTVPVENSLEFAAALHRAGVPVDLHIYENGPHGIGLGLPHTTFETIKFHPWTADCLYWLKERGFVK
jgi:acetyl esterase/lipase